MIVLANVARNIEEVMKCLVMINLPYVSSLSSGAEKQWLAWSMLVPKPSSTSLNAKFHINHYFAVSDEIHL